MASIKLSQVWPTSFGLVPSSARGCDTDVADMIARYTGASLGLLAFAVALIGGLVAGNSPVVTLSRAILALFLFFAIGITLGTIARWVVNEHRQKRESETRETCRVEQSTEAVTGGESNATEGTETVAPIGGT